MQRQYPNDADGDALQRLTEAGNDLSKPLKIDFFVRVPDEKTGQTVKLKLQSVGYDIECELDELSDQWSCYCTREMLATYDAIVRAQNEINASLKPLGLICDGWGTFGS